MALQALQVSLLAPMPTRDRLEGVDVPADQLREGRGASLVPGEFGRIFEGHLPVQDPPLSGQPDNVPVARGAVGLLANLDHWHDRNPGETWSLGSIRFP
jgi:hypothetical protein